MARERDVRPLPARTQPSAEWPSCSGDGVAREGDARRADIALDPRSARVTRAGTPVKLTSHEFRVLSYLMHHRTRVVSQSELTEHIYAQDFDRDSNTVEVFIARLRRKLGASII